MKISIRASVLVAAAYLCGPAAVQAYGAHLGSPAIEPALAGRGDIIFFEDFEASDFYQHWAQPGVPGNCARVQSPRFDGDWSFLVRVPRGQHTGIAWQWHFSRFGLPEPEEVHFRYYIRFADNWWLNYTSQVGKLPGPAGTYGVAGWGGRPSSGDDGWSARMSNYDRGGYVEPSFYCYHADMTGIYGNNWIWGADAYMQRNRWYCVETYVKMNSITGSAGNNDGILRGWIDGRLVFERTDIRFRDVDRLKVQFCWFNVYVGGSWAAEHDMDVYFDNMVIATGYVGPMPPVPGDVNGDGYVNAIDLLALANSWTLSAGDTGFDPACDFNDDGVVNVLDLLTLVHHFGTTG